MEYLYIGVDMCYAHVAPVLRDTKYILAAPNQSIVSVFSVTLRICVLLSPHTKVGVSCGLTCTSPPALPV